MDPLSDVLSLLRPRSYVSSGFSASGAWSVRFTHQQERIKCYAVTAGRCWLAVDGVAKPVLLSQGDCFVLPSGRSFTLASDLALESIDAGTIFPPSTPGGVVNVNGGGEMFLAGSRFAVSGHVASALLGLLPPIIHIHKEQDQAALRWSLDRMMLEMKNGQPGGSLIAQHLAHMMLIQALRIHLEADKANSTGWLAALGHRQISAALNAIHGEPARRWALHELASVACMSRSSFAQRFKELVGTSPMEYLTRWRMLLAEDQLATTQLPIGKISFDLGYESESAFSAAFRRTIGCSPRQYRDAGRPPIGVFRSAESRGYDALPSEAHAIQ
jgi:AraC-like DNA-binding protein